MSRRGRRAPRLEPGEVVIALVAERSYGDGGKHRPVILVEHAGGRDDLWRVMGLTTSPRHADGEDRVEVQDPVQLGLRAERSFLWSPRLTTIPARCVRSHEGWVTDAVVDQIGRATGRSEWEMALLRPQARDERQRSAVA